MTAAVAEATVNPQLIENLPTQILRGSTGAVKTAVAILIARDQLFRPRI